MGRVKKSTIVLLLSLVLVLVFSSFSFATTGVLDNAACLASNGVPLFYMSNNINAHASTSAGNHPYSVCYSSPQGVVLKPTVPAQCMFGNEVASLSATTNAHVEVPTANTYTVPACYGYLECRTSTSGTLELGEQLIAKLSGTTDAHIAAASASSTQYPQYVICKEPICDATAGRSSVYPLISGFESAVENAGVSASGGAAAIISNERAYTGTNSLKLSYPIPAQPAQASDQLVVFSLGNKDKWVSYDYLEFYLFFEQNLGISLKVTAIDGSSKTVAISNAYAPSGISKNRWNLIRIPTSELGVSTGVATMTFVASPSTTANFFASTTYVYYVDSIQLSSKSTTNADFQKYYCTKASDNSFSWKTQITDVSSEWRNLISNLTPNTSSGKVCGEQPGETYADGAYGCFNSVFVTNNTPIDFLKVDGLSLQQNILCSGSLCRIQMPPRAVSGGTPSVTQLASSVDNFILDSYDVKLRTGDLKSTNAPANTENLLAYSLVKPRIVYGTKFTFVDKTNTIATSSATSFYACGAIPTQYQSDQITTLTAPSTIGDACPVVGQYACSPSGFFSKQTGVSADTQPLNSFVSASYNATEAKGCCGPTSCWGDGACRPDQTLSASSTSFGATATDAGYRCYNGKWERGVPKRNFDGSKSGFCAVASQCFVTDAPANGTTSCISSNQFYQNYYCDAGEWTTRTAILAGQMIKFAEDKRWSKGTLYCDHYSVALNTIDNARNIANIFDGIIASDPNNRTCTFEPWNRAPDIYNDYSCVNSFCVFAPDGKQPIFATSLNRPFDNITDLNKAFVDGCKGLTGTSFTQCGTGSKYYYHPGLQLVLYNPNDAGGFMDIALDALRTYIVDPIKSFFSSAQSITEKYELVSESKLFSRFYFTVNPSVSITAFYEVRYGTSTAGGATAEGKPYYVFKIETTGNQVVDLCADVVAPYNKQNQLTGNLAVTCTPEVDSSSGVKKTKTVIVGSQRAFGLWPKLTANLRPS